MSQVQGAFSFVLLTRDQLIAVRDPHGFRPLALGRLGDAMVVCSETCAMDLIGATYVRDVEPGEVLVISEQGMRSIKPFAPAPLAHCVFEHVYFARPDSYVFGKSVNEVRTNLGRILAREQPVDADVVVPVPDSGVCAAMGYAEESGIPLRMGLIRNHYVGRTFIEPQSAIRHFGVRVKLNPVKSILDGQRVILIDDSIVRGTTSRKIVKMVRAAGAREVHVRISCPPTISPCFYGIDTPRRSELIAATHTHRRDHDVSGRGQRGLSEPRGAAECRRLGPRLLLHVLLHRPLPGRVPARRGELPAARAEARQDRGGGGIAMTMTRTLRQQRTRRQHGDGSSWRRALRRFPLRPRAPLRPSFAAAQEPPAPQTVPAAQLQAAIDKLGDLDYATRSNAARTVRRAPAAQAVPALLQTVAEHADGYVRYRALVLLTGFNDPRTKDAMREALTSPNDRLRTVAYSFFEHNPDRAMVSAAARRARQGAGGVRPAGARPGAGGARAGAVGSRLGVEAARVQQALVRDVSRGEDFFRSVVIEALGDYKAAYAFDAITASRQARRSAAGRCGARAGKDRRQTRARDAGGLAAHAPRAAPSRRSPRPSACSASTAPATKTT